ncbi:MAG: hypothetical protein A2X55_04985 [Nitrospirae bacterium GWB2_47_37]|nr:MAG: hypothetical protein A2X55_04985 [Nitrospirae bacterium GWB2_47_37]
MSIVKKAISGALWMSGVNYIGFIINFMIQLILVRLLVPEDFGVFALGLSIADILFIFFGFSFSMAVIRIHEAEDLFDTAFYLSLFSGIVIIITGGIISLFVSSHYALPAILIFLAACAIQPLQLCSSIYSASMEKELQFKKNAIVRGISTNFSGFMAVLLAYLGLGFWSLLGREVLSGILMLLGMRMFSSYRFKGKFNKKTAGMLLDFGYKMLFSRGLEIIYHRVPHFLIGTFAGTRALGLFSQSYYLANLPNTIFGAVHQNVAYAAYSKIQNDREKVNNAFHITNYFSIRLLFPVMLVMFMFPTEILKIFYGSRWLEASPLLGYFAVYAAFLPLFSNAKTLAYSLGRLSDISKIYLISSLLLLIIIFVALSGNNIQISALAYSISILLALMVSFYFLKKENMKIYFKELFFMPLLMSSIIIICWRLFSNSYVIRFSGDKILGLVLLVMIFVVFVTLLFFGDYRVSFKKMKYVGKKILE